MSVAVAVLSGPNAGLATDSLHVQLSRPPACSTGSVKHVRHGARVAAFVGVADFDGHPVATWVHAALQDASTLRDVPGELLRAGALDLVRTYRAWSELVGPGVGAEEFLTLLILEANPNGVEALTVRADVTNGAFTFLYDTTSTTSATSSTGHASPATVLVVGAADPGLLAYTDDGRTLRLAQQLQGWPVTIPAAEPLTAGLTALECQQTASRLVEAAVARQARLPRPHWWPAGIPVLAGPVHSLHL